jgi:hypothetical protein
MFYLTNVDLIAYCVREKVPFTEFETWSSILATVQDILSGKTSVEEVSSQGLRNFKTGGQEKIERIVR